MLKTQLNKEEEKMWISRNSKYSYKGNRK